MIKIKVLRYDPEMDVEPYFETYEVEEKDKMKILDALNYINESYNANIAFRSSCRAGQCGSCALKQNNNSVLACKAEIRDGDIIEPLDFTVIKDLIVDRSDIEGKAKKMRLFLERIDNPLEEPEIIKPEAYDDSKKIGGCIECYSCLSSCPVIKETSEYAGPYFMRYLSKLGMDPRDSDDRAKIGFIEGLYNCTSCGRCSEVCPKEVNIVGGAIEKLREIACNEKIGPLPPHKEVKELIKATGRSVEPLGDGFIKTVSPDSEVEKPRFAFFTGCMIDYKLPENGFALLKILKDHDIDVIVPEDQVCCGSPMIRTGQTEIVEELVKKNEEVFRDYETIITMCAGCGATLKNDYPRYGVNFNVLDITEILAGKLNTDNMKPLNMRVTYHDPCHLARGQGIKIEPRQILNKIKGLEFVEMEEPNRCCGAGGGVRSGKPELAEKMGKSKAEMIKNLDVDAVITVCPFCEYHIKDSLEKAGLSDIKVMNILKLLELAYES
ncbi:MAG: succinate dehydrogenase/fumarate reductase iron-sulfur subunit [Methanobacteriaceae archaeon]|nr:succinate dehydrogenase/fumarate reductase iron-sulfur subunit [Methanobacteriaceae archaeon]